jgi:hypothetical protein
MYGLVRCRSDAILAGVMAFVIILGCGVIASLELCQFNVSHKDTILLLMRNFNHLIFLN